MSEDEYKKVEERRQSKKNLLDAAAPITAAIPSPAQKASSIAGPEKAESPYVAQLAFLEEQERDIGRAACRTLLLCVRPALRLV